ncbi:hypothetical protein P3X46_015965 [Hevea brasiliensis]|uniref:Phosphatidic acid phosphatase type 2/haloperoxidase domain-containing protein n=1 Tax=Hevea brasiliensis TaxID=3981 RepID=A0ABQ9LYZ5_HEVBR|nr:lipid phosphate phosphatase epsilon 2, chloroplastic [Hevea brasiliensis]KAJ9172755.1 hypothetical protein P3X46_015965 [Hevea brasiliensis]
MPRLLLKMGANTALLHKPSFKLSPSHPSNLHSFKPTLHFRVPASTSVFFGEFGFKKIVSKTSITELVKTSEFRTGDDEKNVRMFQQEALVKDSSEFPSELMAERLERTLNRLSKWFVSVLFAAVILWRHDGESMWIGMGSVLNFLLSATLKRIFNQERPFPTANSDPGMPSSHAQSIFYIVVFCILSITECFGVNEFTLITSALTLACGSYFSWLRVSQQYHTIRQVVVGAAVGSLFSFLWHWSWHSIVLAAFVSSLSVRIIIISAACMFCLGFILYVFRHWLKDEERNHFQKKNLNTT